MKHHDDFSRYYKKQQHQQMKILSCMNYNRQFRIYPKVHKYFLLKMLWVDISRGRLYHPIIL